MPGARQMVHDLRLPVRLLDVPTVREPDGLAMSSRNRYLDAGQRQRALCLARALAAGRACLADGQRATAAVEAAMRAELVAADSVDYAAVRLLPELEMTASIQDGRVLLAVAARVGPARLIDNLALRVERGAVMKPA